ncbi:MAG: hypothetical protein J6B59_05775 [Alistipes sp.]|nr:hypothetical protein [Alistipes sp.]
MKKFYSFLVAAVVLMVATSCQKEAVENGFVGENAEFTASIASGRTELGGANGRKVMWNANDNIRIYTQGNAAGTVFNGDATAATATAKFTTTESFTASNNGYLAVYPENVNLELNTTTWTYDRVAATASYADGVWSIPVGLNAEFEEGDIIAGTFYEDNAIMVAHSTNNSLSFKAATAFLKFTYTGTEGYATISFTGGRLTGNATMKYNTADGSITYEDADGSQISLNGLTTNEVYYIPIYPGSVNGVTIREGGNTLIAFARPVTFEAGVIYNMDMPEGMSPWALYDNYFEIGAPVYTASKAGDYHVVKNIPANTNGYCFSKDGGNSSFVGAESVVSEMEKWSATGNEAIYVPDGQEAVDIYLTDDATMYYIAPAGTALEDIPAVPVITYSDYMLFNLDTYNEVKMTIEDGCLVATLKESGTYIIQHTTNYTEYGIAYPGEFLNNTWYKVAPYDGETYNSFYVEAYSFYTTTVYMTEDLSWCCAVAQGGEKPAVPTVSTWGIRGLNGDWDNSVTMYDMGDYSVAYGVTVTSDCTFKFLNTNGVWAGLSGTLNMNAWNSIGGNDIAIAAGTYDFYKLNNPYGSYLICAPGTALPTYKAEVKSNCLYLLPNSYWSEANARFAAYFFGNAGNTWVSMTKVGEEGYYEVEIPTGDYANVIFCRRNPASAANGWDSNNWGQTDDLTVPTNGNNLYTITQTTDNWKAGSWSTLE